MKMRTKGTLLLLEHILFLCLCEALRPGKGIGQSLLQQPKQGVNQKSGRGQQVLQNPSGQGNGVVVGQGNLQRPQKPGQGNRQCGHQKCINFPGLVCDRGHGKCNCPRDKVGDGRVQCADPARQCLCTMYGDPHVTNFKGETFTLPLPCNHVLADLTTPPSKRSKRGCRVFITGRAKFSGRQNNSDISYENQIEISVSTVSAIFTTSINERGFNNPHLTHLSTGVKGSSEEDSSEVDNRQRPNNGIQQIQQYKAVGRRRRSSDDLRVNTRTDEDGFNQVTIPYCQLNVKYRAHDGAFSLQTPVRSAEGRGLCGQCGGKSDRGSTSLTRQQSLQLVLASLYALSPVDHTDANIYPEVDERWTIACPGHVLQSLLLSHSRGHCSALAMTCNWTRPSICNISCTALTETIASCPGQRKPHATTFCGEMLTNPDVNNCLAGKGGKEHVQDVFATCFRFVCTRYIQCGKYLALFSDCLPTARATELVKDKPFCT